MWKRGDDPEPFAGVVMSPDSWGDPGADLAQLQAKTAGRAHDTAVKAGGFLTTKERKGRKFGGGPVDKGT
jgi:hypothetical protein